MRIAPPEFEEIGIAHHEAGHAVASTLFSFPWPVDTARIWSDEERGGWAGRVEYGEGADYMPDPKSTPPHRMAQSVEDAWTDLVISCAGPAASRRFVKASLDAASVRQDETGTSDEFDATIIAAHFWPPEHQETVLNAAAELAGMLVQTPRFWAAVEAVAGYLVEQHKADPYVIESLVRRTLPVVMQCPNVEFAVLLAED